jgi:hypothetical protein
MIGVLSRSDEREVAAEFFELFKTPWEFCQSGRTYDMIVSTLGQPTGLSARLVRVVPDLFTQVRRLLSEGQPEADASVPTLDLLIAQLRDSMVNAGLPVVEIPPAPADQPFIVCLTHDVDHPSLRNHKLDHSALGFLLRATIGGGRGGSGVREILTNWGAAARFPFVHLGLAADPWSRFDRYLDWEPASTFFFIPRKGDPGRNVQRHHPERRAARYDLADVQPQLERIRGRGAEVALHGIDAWLDPAKAREERERIGAAAGVRMHWLCFAENSPAILDEAGFSYDSTVGYNETVGYRAGTLQAYRPLGAKQLLELPLHIMDTALFYPDYLNLSKPAAGELVRRFFNDARRHSGVLTLNWHDRSIAPERLWGDLYLDLLTELKRLNPWFATASDAVAWFRLRRAARFDVDNGVVKVQTAPSGRLPGLRLRITTKDGVREICGHATGTTELSLAA